MKLEVLFEDNHLLIVNKPCGIPSQSDVSEDPSMIDYAKDFLREKYKKQGNIYAGLPHRLDRPTSGVLVLTKTSKSHERMVKLFNEHNIKKQYLAIVDGTPKEYKATLKHYITKDSQTNKSKAHIKNVKNSKEAIMDYEVIGASDNYALLLVNLHTGRHHQIRAQLATLGLHIKGDLKYGAERSNKDGGIDLHSFKIEFEHPVNHSLVKVFAKPPEGPLWDYFYSLIESYMKL